MLAQFLLDKAVLGDVQGAQIQAPNQGRRQVLPQKVAGHLLAGEGFPEKAVVEAGDRGWSLQISADQ